MQCVVATQSTFFCTRPQKDARALDYNLRILGRNTSTAAPHAINATPFNARPAAAPDSVRRRMVSVSRRRQRMHVRLAVAGSSRHTAEPGS